MKWILVLLSVFGIAGCGVSSSTLDEEIAKVRDECNKHADDEAAKKSQDVQGVTMKRIVDIETNFATRTAMDEAIRKSQVKTLDDCDKKLAVLEGQMEEVKKKVEVVNMANREEVMSVLTQLQTITVSMVQQLKAQRDALDASIKQLEAIHVPDAGGEDKPK